MAAYLSISGTGVSGSYIPKSGTITLKFTTDKSYIRGNVFISAINSSGTILGDVDAYDHASAGLSWEQWDNDGYPLEIGNGKNLSTFTVNLSSLYSYFYSKYTTVAGIWISGNIDGSYYEEYWDSYGYAYWFADPTLSNVTGLSATQLDNGYVRIKWNACSGSYGSTGITYRICTGSATGTQVWSGTTNSVDLSIASKFSYGTSYRIYVVAEYSGISKNSSVTRTFTAPYVTQPTNLISTTTIGPNTTLSWSASSVKHTTSTSGITYTIYKDGTSLATTSSTSYAITESIASAWADTVILTVKASATGLSNTYSGTTITSVASNGVSYTYASVTDCAAPKTFEVSDSLSYIPVQLIWDGAEDGVVNTITAYHIQYQDCADGTSWPETWIDFETDWPASPLEVSPPDTIGHYRRFRIQVKGSAGADYYSDWLISSNVLRKDMAPFEGFTDPELTALSTKIKAIHMTEMQNRINDLLLFNGKEAYSFTSIEAGKTRLSGWTSHVTEIRNATDSLKPSHEDWLEITENRPRVDVMTQLRDIIIGYCKVTITVDGENGVPEGCVVTVRNMEDDSVIAEFAYMEPQMIRIAPGTTYRVECSKSDDYTVSPVSETMTAQENTIVSVELMYRNAMRYGFRREKANADPSARITYLYDAEGMTPMSVNLTTGEPDYGSWKTFIDEVCRPVMLKYDGTVDYELDHDDQTKKLDGTASDIANTAYEGNAMVEFRKYKWVKRYEDEDYEYVIFSDVQWDEDYHAYANTNENTTNQDVFYWGMFEGSKINGVMRSIADQTPASTQTTSDEISQAQANGAGWYLIYKSGWDFIIDILTLISKTDNSQAAFGYGSQNNSSALKTGTLKNKPMFCGYSTGTSDVKTLYIEGLWGNLWERLAGVVYNKTNGLYVKMTPPYNIDGTGYNQAGKITGTSASFVSGSSCTDAFGYLPTSLSGSENTYMCDKVWYSTSGNYYGMVGGRWTLGTGCGSRCMNFSDLPTIQAAYTGARLSYLNPAK